MRGEREEISVEEKTRHLQSGKKAEIETSKRAIYPTENMGLKSKQYSFIFAIKLKNLE